MLLVLLALAAHAASPDDRRAATTASAVASPWCAVVSEGPEADVERWACPWEALEPVLGGFTSGTCAEMQPRGFTRVTWEARDGRADCDVATCACTATDVVAEADIAALVEAIEASWSAGRGRKADGVAKVRDRLAKRYGADHLVRFDANSATAAAMERGPDALEALPLRRALLADAEATFGPEALNTSVALEDLGRLLTADGRPAEAVPLLERALAIEARTFGDSSKEAAGVWALLGEAHLAAGELDLAERAFRKESAILQEDPGIDTPEFAMAMTRRAELSATIGGYNAAIAFLSRAEELVREGWGAMSPERGRILLALGTARLATLGTGQDASPEDFAVIQASMDVSLAAWGLRSPAMADAMEATARFNRMGDVGNPRLAAALALKIRENHLTEGHPATARALGVLASVDLLRGDTDRALAGLERAEEMTRDRGSPLDRAEILRLLSLSRQLSGDLPGALGPLAESARLEEDALQRVFSSSDGSGKQAWLAAHGGAMERAVTLHTRYLPDDAGAAEEALLAILRRKGRGVDGQIEDLAAVRAVEDPRADALVAELGDLGRALAGLVLRGPDGDPNAWRAEAMERRIDLAEQERHIASWARGWRRPIDPSVAGVRSALPADTALVEIAVVGRYALDPADYELQPGQEAMWQASGEHGQRLFSWFQWLALQSLSRGRYVAYVVTAEGAVQHADLGWADEIDAAVERVLAPIRECQSGGCRSAVHTTRAAAPVASEMRDAARALDDRVFVPLEPLLGGATRVLIAPDSSLGLVPWDALVAPDGELRIQKVEIDELGSGRELLRMGSPASASGPALVMADPEFGGQDGQQLVASADVMRSASAGPDQLRGTRWTRLPGTAQEAEAVLAVLPGARSLTGAAATEAALREADSPRILHVATHGFFFAPVELSSAPEHDPLLRSGLVLSGADGLLGDGADDGILTGREIAALDLSGTELVVLSACETGAGQAWRGEGVAGLRKAFQAAGTRTQVMSLWQVSDEATAALMASFYRHLADGQGRGEALRSAKLELLASERWSHPYYWAAFVLSGDWRPLPP